MSNTEMNSSDIAINEIQSLDEQHISEELAEWCFKIAQGVIGAVIEMPMSDADKKRALTLSAILILNLEATQ